MYRPISYRLIYILVCYLMHEMWSVGSQENHRNNCHQTSHFLAKMHQIRFRLGLRPRPQLGSLQRSPDSLAGLRGPTSKGRGGKGRKGEDMGGREERGGKGREGREEEWRGGDSGVFTIEPLGPCPPPP